MKRITLFAGYNINNRIEDYVVYAIKALKRFSDVHYLADSYIPQSELEKIKPYTTSASAIEHGEYDFGSWKRMSNKIGWEKIQNYDELILVNDSIYFPIFPLRNIFEEFESSDAGFGGLIKNYEIYPHIQSFFMMFKKEILLDCDFKHFLEGVSAQSCVNDVINNYEIGLSKYLYSRNYKSYAFIDKIRKKDLTAYPIDLLKKSFPAIKRKVFTTNYFAKQDPLYIGEFIINNTDYPFELIEKSVNYKDWVLSVSLYNRRVSKIKFVQFYLKKYGYEKYIFALKILLIHKIYRIFPRLRECLSKSLRVILRY
jgi:lipopolysaccharide biosynthesis protein